MQKTYKVEFSKFAEKQIERLPESIVNGVETWKYLVEYKGLPEVRKTKAYHDEPLKGRRDGQRSVRLNRAYRLFYEENEQNEIIVVGVKEVNKHDY